MKSVPILSTLLRHWLPIGLVALAVTAGVYLYSSSRTPVYTATATEYFSLGSATSAADLAQGSNYVQDQMSSYGELATAPVVLNPVIDKLRLPVTYRELSRNVAAVTPRNTVILQISATDSSPQLASSIANAVGTELATAVERVSPKGTNGKALVTVQTIQTAVPPTVQSAPNTRLNTALALGVGLALGCVLVLLVRRLDPRITTANDVAKIASDPPLGAVRHFKALGPAPNLFGGSGGLAAEDMRRLRSAVEEITEAQAPAVIAVTSSIRQEGRSTIALNLGLALAEAGHRVVLVETDFRSSARALSSGPDDRGLMSVLTKENSVDEVIQRYPDSSLDVLNAGGTSQSPTALLTSPLMSHAVSLLRQEYRYIILDAPALEVSDTLSLRPLLDRVIFVVRVARVRSEQLEQALGTATAAGLPVSGVVLNDVRERRELARSSASYLDRPPVWPGDPATSPRADTRAKPRAEAGADSHADAGAESQPTNAPS